MINTIAVAMKPLKPKGELRPPASARRRMKPTEMLRSPSPAIGALMSKPTMPGSPIPNAVAIRPLKPKGAVRPPASAKGALKPKRRVRSPSPAISDLMPKGCVPGSLFFLCSRTREIAQWQSSTNSRSR
jgi:hypothetical protein